MRTPGRARAAVPTHRSRHLLSLRAGRLRQVSRPLLRPSPPLRVLAQFQHCTRSSKGYGSRPVARFLPRLSRRLRRRRAFSVPRAAPAPFEAARHSQFRGPHCAALWCGLWCCRLDYTPQTYCSAIPAGSCLGRGAAITRQVRKLHLPRHGVFRAACHRGLRPRRHRVTTRQGSLRRRTAIAAALWCRAKRDPTESAARGPGKTGSPRRVSPLHPSSGHPPSSIVPGRGDTLLGGTSPAALTSLPAALDVGSP